MRTRKGALVAFFGVMCWVACGEGDQNASVEYSGGPLVACPTVALECFEGKPRGTECEDGDVLVTQCLVGECGDCCETVFNFTRPCCHGYWLHYTNEFEFCSDTSSVALCPRYIEGFVSDGCQNYSMTCSCKSGGLEDGWNVVTGGDARDSVCKVKDDMQVGVRVFFEEAVNWGDCNNEASIAQEAVNCSGNKMVWGDGEIKSKPEEAFETKRQVRECLLKRNGDGFWFGTKDFFCSAE